MSMLNMIAVCDSEFQPVTIVPEYLFNFNLFQDDQHKKFKEKILPNIPTDILSNAISFFYVDQDYFYAGKVKKGQEELVLILSSRSRISAGELTHLFVNISHILNNRICQSLDEVFINPLGFTGKDLQVDKVLQDMAETKDVMRDVINKMMERGVKLEELNMKTHDLVQVSVDFHKKSKQLNSSCC